jgi:hypothetical protein
MGVAIHGTEGAVKGMQAALHGTERVGKQVGKMLSGAVSTARTSIDAVQPSAIGFPTHPLPQSPPANQTKKEQAEQAEQSTPVQFDEDYVPYSPRSSDSRRTSRLEEMAAAGNAQVNAPPDFLTKSAIFSKRTYEQPLVATNDVTSPSASSTVSTAAGMNAAGHVFLSTLNAARHRREDAEADGMTVPSLGIAEKWETAPDQDKY